VNRALAACVLGLVIAGRARAGGFMLFEQSGRGLRGSAFAGEVAEAADASTIQYTPRARVDRRDAIRFLGLRVLPAAHFSNDDSMVNPALGRGSAPRR
jgi:long-subunit fatty acid transport protein